MALTARPIMLSPTQPPYFDIPSFKYRPEFGSHGTGPLVSSVSSVSATSQQGGYREVGDRGWDLNEVQCHNTLRLMTFVWGSNDAKAFGSIAGGLISREHAASLSKLLRARFGTRSTHQMYLIVQENVQCYDLGVNIRNLARTAVLYKLIASPDESQAAINRRKTIAVDYQTASYELRDRAIARIDEHIDELATSCAGIAGLVQITRLESLRARFEVDPFENLDLQFLEPLYSRLTEFERRAFWLARYDENIVAWYWDCRDLIDIRATIAEEPMRTHSREEFAHVCDAMWVMRIHNKSFPRRTKENLASYLETCSGFSDLFNEERDASLAVNGGAVRSLGFVK